MPNPHHRGKVQKKKKKKRIALGKSIYSYFQHQIYCVPPTASWFLLAFIPVVQSPKFTFHVYNSIYLSYWLSFFLGNLYATSPDNINNKYKSYLEKQINKNSTIYLSDTNQTKSTEIWQLKQSIPASQGIKALNRVAKYDFFFKSSGLEVDYKTTKKDQTCLVKIVHRDRYLAWILHENRSPGKLQGKSIIKARF